MDWEKVMEDRKRIDSLPVEKISLVDCAKEIRGKLKENFPGVKFSVRINRKRKNNSINISWENGPCVGQVSEICNRYDGSFRYFDKKLDKVFYYESNYVFYSRSFSTHYLSEACNLLAGKWGERYPGIRNYGDSGFLLLGESIEKNIRYRKEIKASYLFGDMEEIEFLEEEE